MTPSVSLSAAAFVAGMVDSIAGGGGLITVPALLAAGITPQLAVGTNKGQAVFGALSSAFSFSTRVVISPRRALLGFLAGAVGAIAGASILLRLRSNSIRSIAVVLLVIAGAIVVFRPRVKSLGISEPLRTWAWTASALSLGAYDGFFGPGVGTLLIITFSLIYGEGPLTASGNAKVVNLASNLAAVLFFAWRGNILWEIALPMAVANAAGAAVGVRIAMRGGDVFVRAQILAVIAGVLTKLAIDWRGLP